MSRPCFPIEFETLQPGAQHRPTRGAARTGGLVRAATAALVLAIACPAAASTLPRLGSQPGAPRQEDARSARAAAIAYATDRHSAIAQSQSGTDLDASRAALEDVIDHPLFATLRRNEQRALVSAAAWVDLRAGRFDDAAALYRQAVELDPGDPDDWHRLSMAEDERGDSEAAAAAVLRILSDWPHLADALSEGLVLSIVDRLPSSSPSRLALMTALFEANWKRVEQSAAYIWADLALAYVESGQPDAAREVIARIGWPGPLISMQADRRFDALLPSGPKYVEDALRELIGRLAALCADNPRNLYIHNDWLDALLQAGRHEEVLELSTLWLDRIAAAEPGRPAFHDSDDHNFTLDLRADALIRLGRIDEAIAALERASAMAEFGEPNSTQKMSLARLYNRLGRPDDAMQAVARLPATTGSYGFAQRDVVLVHASALRADQAAVERHLSRLRTEGPADSLDQQTNALLHAGKIEDAAALFIRCLQDPRERGDALWMAQQTREEAQLPGDVAYDRSRAAMLTRADVRAAIDAVGRVQSYDVW